ncbi:MAG: prolipoprotein diacylglyceryl transferase family protein [Planctomycetota bacterium]
MIAATRPVAYFVFVAAGLAVAAFAARWQGRRTDLDSAKGAAVRMAALLGAIAGAYLLQLPADLIFFYEPAHEGSAGDAMPLGGRTVLGGLLGGIGAVELQKRRLRIHSSTGDSFALPLALALAFGRLGCWFAGCCGGRVCEPAWWTVCGPDGETRVPVQLVESVVHFGAAAAFAVLSTRARPGPSSGRAFATYVTAYGVLRVLLEEVRNHPRVLGPLTWHQGLSLCLVSLGLWLLRRSRTRTNPIGDAGQSGSR